jgi:hypothetical protein
MNYSLHVVIGLSLIVALIASTHANHSLLEFDAANPITLHGTVKSFTWANPHGWVILHVEQKDALSPHHAGLWQIQTRSPSQLSAQGWTKQTLKAGDQLSIVVSPARTESRSAFAGFIKVINDKEFRVQ